MLIQEMDGKLEIRVKNITDDQFSAVCVSAARFLCPVFS